MNALKISFIVLTYNRADALLAVLQSLASQCGADHEVLVADDGSNALQVSMIREHCPTFKCPVRHVWHADIGFTAAAARNLGAYHATGEYLVFLDGDCVPGTSFVKAHTRLAHTGCFVNGSRVLLGERLTGLVVEHNMELAKKSLPFWIKARLKGDSNKLLHMLGWPLSLFRVKKDFEWKGIRSCNLAVWRADFFAVNGFDETFEGWGHEDADLVLRLCNQGIQRKNGFWATEVYHLWHREHQRHSESVNKQKVFDRMKTHQTRAEKGLAEIEPHVSGQVTRLQ
jgi:glycosyltransferase involved in cell wall biosynthesis